MLKAMRFALTLTITYQSVQSLLKYNMGISINN